jgi:hypothetical protein
VHAEELAKQMTHLLKNRHKQTAALASAAELPMCRVAANTLDVDPWLMGVPNGVLDLHRGRLVDAEPVTQPPDPGRLIGDSVRLSFWLGVGGQGPLSGALA